MHTAVRTMFPVPLKNGFDYLRDFRLWPHWYVGMIEILAPEEGLWAKAGDTVRFAYKLLGRRLEGEVVLEVFRECELVRFTARVPGLSDVHQAYRFAEAGPSDFSLQVEMEAGEATFYFGKVVDRMLLPRALERDLNAAMENLNDVFATGLHT